MSITFWPHRHTCPGLPPFVWSRGWIPGKRFRAWKGLRYPPNLFRWPGPWRWKIYGARWFMTFSDPPSLIWTMPLPVNTAQCLTDSSEPTIWPIILPWSKCWIRTLISRWRMANGGSRWSPPSRDRPCRWCAFAPTIGCGYCRRIYVIAAEPRGRCGKSAPCRVMTTWLK